jgi:hypothetical protein
MFSYLFKLWGDDRGAVAAPGVVLLLSIAVIGTIPGLVALRNATNAALGTVGNEIMAVQTGFSFAPYAIKGTNTIASVDGCKVTIQNVPFLKSSSAGQTNTYDSLVVDAAP